MATLRNALVLIVEYLQAILSLREVFPWHRRSPPHQHCVWNCRMTRAMGPEFAAEYSLQKERIDNAYADLRDSLQAEECWCYLPFSVRELIDDHGDSASQVSDFVDNAAGIGCGFALCFDPDPTDDSLCEDCCSAMGIGPKTKDRPFGPRSQDPRMECPGDPPRKPRPK